MHSDESPRASTQDETSQDDALQRGLSARHLTMISIGGAIGTGLFVASGKTIHDSGPGGALVAYGLIGVMVFLLMQSLGEMAAYIPVAGSFGEYGARFISPSFGFATGWNFWYNWAITVAAELVAASLVMKYWFPDVPGWVWSAVFLSILVALNALSARAYGEGEFWFALVKVVVVVVFLVLGVLIIAGILGDTHPGFDNWTKGEAPFVNGFAGVLAIFMVAGFSFQGTEMVGVAAGEAANPEKQVPKAIRTIFWRILLFYIGAIFVIGTLIYYKNSSLLGEDVTDVAISPFTLVFKQAGVAAAAAVMNAVILTSVLSAGNSGLYASTRMLYALAHRGSAPALFKRTNSHGVPIPALVMSTLVGAACFISSLIGDGKAYEWLVNASGLAGFITWMGIAGAQPLGAALPRPLLPGRASPGAGHVRDRHRRPELRGPHRQPKLTRAAVELYRAALLPQPVGHPQARHAPAQDRPPPSRPLPREELRAGRTPPFASARQRA